MRIAAMIIFLGLLGVTATALRDAGQSWRAWNPVDIWAMPQSTPVIPLRPEALVTASVMPAPLVLPMRQPVAAPMRTAAPVAPPLPTTLWNGVRFTIIKPGVWQDDQMRQWRPITASTTAYTWVDGVSVEPGKTAKRTCAKTTYGIASDWSVIKPGTSIWVPGYGIQSVDDKCGRSMKNWRTYREVVLDLRIPNQRHDGRWRSNGDIVQIATKHGYQRKRTVLVRINESL